MGCGAAIVVEGRLLLLRRSTEPEAGSWGLPGGKVDLFETAAAATAREIHEELGIAIVPIDLLCLCDHIDETNGVHWVAPIFLLTAFLGEPHIREPQKHDGLQWFALNALPSPLTSPTLSALRALRARAAM